MERDLYQEKISTICLYFSIAIVLMMPSAYVLTVLQKFKYKDYSTYLRIHLVFY